MFFILLKKTEKQDSRWTVWDQHGHSSARSEHEDRTVEGLAYLKVLEVRQIWSTDNVSVYQRHRWYERAAIPSRSRWFLHFLQRYLPVSLNLRCEIDWSHEIDIFILFYDPISSVHLRWEQETNYRGINGYRYSVTQDFLNRLDDCFCINKIKDALTDDRGCLYPGALDLSDCVGELRWWLIEDVWKNKLIEYSL